MPIRTVNVVSGQPKTRKPFRKLSILYKLLKLALGLNLCLLAGEAPALAQTIRTQITVPDQSSTIRVEVQLPTPTDSLSFMNTYAGVIGLGERIEKLTAVNDVGETIEVRKLAPGVFQSEVKFSRFSYEVNLAGPLRPAQMSHVSWLNSERGILMLADLLPQRFGHIPATSAAVELQLPKSWLAASNTRRNGSHFSTDDSGSAVFSIGSSVREKSRHRSSNRFSIITSGKWPFSEDEAIKIAERVLEQHSRVTRSELNRDTVVMLAPYPGDAGPENWTAETRGNTVVLLIGNNANRKRVLARLGIVLSHELFHLWIPNSLKLDGDYDWFFEGFTLYHALRTNLRLGLIDFDGFLNTMAKVNASYLAKTETDRLSLIEISERRWTTASSLVYEKGMLAAFVYDLTLRRLSKCGASLDDVYADLFRLPATGHRNANETIIRLLTKREGMKTFSKDYIEAAARIRLEAALEPFGIQVQSPSKLVVQNDLTTSQRRLLDCLGYKK